MPWAEIIGLPNTEGEVDINTLNRVCGRKTKGVCFTRTNERKPCLPGGIGCNPYIDIRNKPEILRLIKNRRQRRP